MLNQPWDKRRAPVKVRERAPAVLVKAFEGVEGSTQGVFRCVVKRKVFLEVFGSSSGN